MDATIDWWLTDFNLDRASFVLAVVVAWYMGWRRGLNHQPQPDANQENG